MLFIVVIADRSEIAEDCSTGATYVEMDSMALIGFLVTYACRNMTIYTEELSYHRCLPVPLFITTLPNPVGTTSMSAECQRGVKDVLASL